MEEPSMCVKTKSKDLLVYH